MALLIVPTSVDPKAPIYQQVTTLEGVDYTFYFKWNQREEVWYLSIGDNEGALVAAGLPIVVNWNLLRGLVDTGLPPGVLMALDDTPYASDPGLEELGADARVVLYYFEQELAESLGLYV